MLSELSPQLDDFVAKHVNNFVKWDLVVHFYEHREVVVTSHEIATRLGRRSEDVDSALADLVDGEILRKEDTGADPVYSFRADGPRLSLVADFVDALDSREQRLQILTKLLRLGARG